MIEWIRKHMGWLMWIIVGLITVTFLFFGIYPSSESGRAVAKVGSYVITVDEWNRAYQALEDNYRDLLKDKFNEQVAKSLRNQALQELIVNRLLIDEAKLVGLHVSNKELREHIMNMPSFSRNGKFDKEIYDRILERINMKPSVFEEQQREYLLRQKLEYLIRDSVAVDDADLAKAYRERNPKAKPGEFEKNKESFRKAVLAQKQRDALTAFIRTIETRIPVRIEEKGRSS